MDELNLDKLNDEEKTLVFKTFAPDNGMRIYERGIRRRLAPMLHGDSRRIKMAYSLLFSLPGAVMIPYGDEIGIGENLQLPERNSVRLPMQWNDDVNGGFSDSSPKALVAITSHDGPFGYKKVNVKIQEKDEESILNYIRSLAEIKQHHQELTQGDCQMIKTRVSAANVVIYSWQGKKTLIVTNLSDKPINVSVTELKGHKFKEFFCDGVYKSKEEKAEKIPVNGYGFRWFTVE